MKQLYTYYPEFADDECVYWRVYENNTKQIIHSFFFEDDAQEYCFFLEKGGAFAGFTPSFITKKNPVAKNIDEAFSLEFA
jgi:hypothetical protein